MSMNFEQPVTILVRGLGASVLARAGLARDQDERVQASTGGTPAPTFTQPTQGIQAFAASEPTTSLNTRPRCS